MSKEDLYYMEEEQNLTEIADFLDMPIGTIRSRLHHARNLLRINLLDYVRKRGYKEPV